MRIFPERVAREQVLWLLGHAVALTVAQVSLFLAGLRISWEIAPEDLAQYISGLVGTAAAALVAPVIAALCVRRLFRPFACRKMHIDMKLYLTAELIVWFLSGTILDGGFIQQCMLRLSFAINFVLLGFVATPREVETPPEEPS